MKKLLIILPVIAAAVLVCVFVSGGRDYPEGCVFNYLDSETVVKCTDNYTVCASPFSGVTVCTRGGETEFSLLDSADSENMKKSVLVQSDGDNLYIYSPDARRGGYSLFVWDLNTLKKKTVSSANGIVNYNAFLGMGELLGIQKPAAEIVMQTGGADRWADRYGLRDIKTVFEQITRLNGEAAGLSLTPEKFAATDDALYFLNDYSQLLCFNYEKKSLSVIKNTRLSDFFIHGENIYYGSLSDGKWYACTLNGENDSFAFEGIEVSSVRICGNEIFISDKSFNIYRLNGTDLEKTGLIDTDRWDTDGEFIYYYNAREKRLESAQIQKTQSGGSQ